MVLVLGIVKASLEILGIGIGVKKVVCSGLVENALSLILKSQQNRIELVTRPARLQEVCMQQT